MHNIMYTFYFDKGRFFVWISSLRISCSCYFSMSDKNLWQEIAEFASKLPMPVRVLLQVVKRGFEDKLIIDGTSYNDQGEYVCEAVNMIAGRRNTVQSGPVKMEVRGIVYMQNNIQDYLLHDFVKKRFSTTLLCFYSRFTSSSAAYSIERSGSHQWKRCRIKNGSVLRPNTKQIYVGLGPSPS